MANFFKKKKKTAPPPPTDLIVARTESLKAEIARLSAELEGYKKREKEITEALVFAKERVDEYEKEAKLRFRLEYERLAAYRNSWTSRVKRLGDAEKLGEAVIGTQEFFKKCCDDLKRIAEGDIPPQSAPEEDFKRECERLGVPADRLTVAVEEKLTDSELKELLVQALNKNF